jgi:UDP-N-acetylmuramoyl-tripeptide--D-alanyl-D-alanine ligase
LQVVAGKGSFNNEVGVPLTLLEADDETDVIVVEMGMQAPGDIAELCKVAAPDIAIITNIGPSHLEYSGSLEKIAAGKAEIAGCIPPGGALVVPYREALLEPHLADLDLEIVTFGFDTGADIYPVSETTAADRLHSVINCRGQELELEFNFAARHHLLNAMAAIGAYQLLGLPLDVLEVTAARVDLSDRRGEHLRLAGEVLLINDCYNANPLSMQAALDHLAQAAGGGRAIAVLGDMGELGTESQAYHREVGRAAARLGIDLIIAVGELAPCYLEGAAETDAGRGDRRHVACEDAITDLIETVRPGDVVLVKASRFMRLERIADALAGAHPGGGTSGKGG